MKNDEEKLSEFIDRLNAERKPDAFSEEDEGLDELYSTAKLVRSLKEPEMPNSGFEEELISTLTKQVQLKEPRKHRKRRLAVGFAGIAVAIVFLFTVLLPMSRPSIVEAMEKAYSEMHAYHGVIDVISANEEGASATQAKLEVWADQDGRYYVNGIEGYNEGVTTVNDGEKKWQLDSANEEIHLLPAFPDTYRFTFELGNEIDQIATALSTAVIGEEKVAGDGPLNPASSALIATINGLPAEIQFPLLVETGLLGAGTYGGMTDIISIRWQQDGFEFVVAGNASRDELELFAEKVAGGAVEMPASDKGVPEVEVPYDIAAWKIRRKASTPATRLGILIRFSSRKYLRVFNCRRKESSAIIRSIMRI